MKKNCQTLGLTLLLGVIMTVQGNLNAQTVYIKMGKEWCYITDSKRAVNESNRVSYLIGSQTPFGSRVNNFRDMEPYYKHDSEFLDAYLSVAEVYESSKMVAGPAFFMAKTEVTNEEYRKFVESCIAKWMKENRPEIAQKYKWNSLEYVHAVQAWLESSSVASGASGAERLLLLLAPAANWGHPRSEPIRRLADSEGSRDRQHQRGSA